MVGYDVDDALQVAGAVEFPREGVDLGEVIVHVNSFGQSVLISIYLAFNGGLGKTQHGQDNSRLDLLGQVGFTGQVTYKEFRLDTLDILEKKVLNLLQTVEALSRENVGLAEQLRQKEEEARELGLELDQLRAERSIVREKVTRILGCVETY